MDIEKIKVLLKAILDTGKLLQQLSRNGYDVEGTDRVLCSFHNASKEIFNVFTDMQDRLTAAESDLSDAEKAGKDSSPETNGKSNWTAILYRKSEEWLGGIAEGITIDRSEYPDRVRYEADRMRYLIGEIEKEPFILDYDSDKRSDYVYPENPEIVELKAALTLIMRAAEGAKVDCGSDPEGPDAIRNGALASIAAVAAQGLGLSKGPKLSEGV